MSQKTSTIKLFLTDADKNILKAYAGLQGVSLQVVLEDKVSEKVKEARKAIQTLGREED